MSQRVGVLELSPRAVVVVDGADWLVESFAPQYGHVSLQRGDGATMRTTVRGLLTKHACRRPTGSPTPVTGSAASQPVGLADLTADQRELALLRFAHVLEVETGFRGGDPLRPAPGEPRGGYDPQATTLTARRLAKLAELKALNARDARRLGFAHASLRTLERLGADCRRFGVAGAILGSWVRRGGGRPEYHRTGPRGDLRGAGRDAAPVPDQHEGAAAADLPVRAREVRRAGAGAVLRDVA